MTTEQAETVLRSLWEAREAPPFPAQLSLAEDEAARMLACARGAACARVHLFEALCRDAPTLAVWATLQGLARGYETADRSVYPLIEDALGISLPVGEVRDRFKSAFAAALANLGIRPTDPRDPTSLFFSALGIPDTALNELAGILLSRARRLGLPAHEDERARRLWQRRAVIGEFATRPRLRAGLSEDRTGYYTYLFGLWRADERPTSMASGTLFAALDRAAARSGTRKADLAPEPVLVWGRKGLSLLNETAGGQQTIGFGGPERHLPSGRPVGVPEPWPDKARWRAGAVVRDLRIAPHGGEIMIFDMTSGRLVHRGSLAASMAERVPLSEGALLALSDTAFTADGAESVPYGSYFLLPLDLGPGGLTIEGPEGKIELGPDHTPGLRIQGPVIGRAGATPLLTSAARIGIVAVPSGQEESRLLRLEGGGRVWFAAVRLAADGTGEARLDDIGFDAPADPGFFRVSLLAPGMEARVDTRAESAARVFVWPGTSAVDPGRPFDIAPVPSNWRPETSAGIGHDGTRLWTSDLDEVEAIVLSLDADGMRRDVHVPFKGTRVTRVPVQGGAAVHVPAHSVLPLTQDIRHDTIVVRSSARDADLLACGTRVRRPFIARESWPLTVRALGEAIEADDQVALLHPDGRRELLFRVAATDEAGECAISEAGAGLEIALGPGDHDAVAIDLLGEDGETIRAAASLGPRPVEHALQSWIEVEPQPDGACRIALSPPPGALPAGLHLVTPLVRPSGEGVFLPVLDRDGRAFAGALDTTHDPGPGARAGRLRLAQVAAWVATPWPDSVEPLLRPALEARRDALVQEERRGSMLHPLWPALTAAPLEWTEGGGEAFLPRTDLFSVAPDLLERPLSDLLSASGALAPLARSLQRARATLDGQETAYDGDLAAWLLVILEDDRAAAGMARQMRDAFRALRLRMETSDMPAAMARGPLAGALRDTLSAHAEEAGVMIYFDERAGPDRRGVRIAQHLARLARAARRSDTSAFHARLGQRLGAPLREAARVSALLLHTAPELAGLFLALEDRAPAPAGPARETAP